jgi:hypothetical protein
VVFRVLTTCSLAGGYQCFGVTYRLHLQGRSSYQHFGGKYCFHIQDRNETVRILKVPGLEFNLLLHNIVKWRCKVSVQNIFTSTMKMEAKRFSETLVTSHKTTRRHNPEALSWYLHRRENPRSQFIVIILMLYFSIPYLRVYKPHLYF